MRPGVRRVHTCKGWECCCRHPALITPCAVATVRHLPRRSGRPGRSGQTRAGRASRPYVAAHLGAYRLLRRFPLGSCCRDRRPAPTAQSRQEQDRRMINVPDPFTLSVVYMTTDAMPSVKRSRNLGPRSHCAQTHVRQHRSPAHPRMDRNCPPRSKSQSFGLLPASRAF